MAQKAEKHPTPTNTVLDGKVAATGNQYPDSFFINPWNAMLDTQYGDESGRANESKTLYSPTNTVTGMGAIPLHGKDAYDSNWEHGYRDGVEGGKKGRR